MTISTSDYSMPFSVQQAYYHPDPANTKTSGHASYYTSSHYPTVSYNNVQSLPASRVSSRPASPVFQQFPAPTVDAKGRRSSAAAISAYLQLPSTITNSKGSLSEFAAQITCLFWFETSYTLSHIEDSRLSPVATSRLIPEAFPSTGFLKWVTTILSTTQVTQNVILLALLFIYRLKKQCPTVKGLPGSEYRLLTVALMLGNKFLDDNTYTNKTWAEVSGISVQEIHVMEVEFLSHMKYTLYTSAESWQQWHQQLGVFWNYFDRASKKTNDIMTRPSITLKPSPLQLPYALPSPPSSTGVSPPYLNAPMAPMSAQLNSYNQQWTPSNSSGSSMNSTLEPEPRPAPRKRSYDATSLEPPTKRQYSGPTPPQPNKQTSYAGFSGSQTTYPSLPSLPTPYLQLPQQHIATTQNLGALTPGFASAHQMGCLPPVNWLHGVPQLLPTTTIPPPSTGHSSVPSHRQALRAIGSGSRDNSPSHARYTNPSASHTPSQAQLSPSYFLTQRNSPYRPVRDISTLRLPPQAGLSHEPATNISYDQMHWQPLAKNTNQTNQGRVPYLHREAWPVTHQVEHWPSIGHARH